MFAKSTPRFLWSFVLGCCAASLVIADEPHQLIKIAPFDAENTDVEFDLVQETQTQPPSRPSTPPRPTRPPSSSRSRPIRSVGNYRTSSRVRLARVPDMFGDSFFRGATLTATQGPGPNPITSIFDVPIAGGRGSKIGDNNKALPYDRVYVTYQHFHNAFNTSTVATGLSSVVSKPLDRYTFGWEQTLFDGLCSVELRLPMGNDFHYNATGPQDVINVQSGEIGNMSVILKRMLYESSNRVISAGVGIESPTASDTVAQVGLTTYRIQNEAVHILPFIAMMNTRDDWFCHTFIQLDIPTSGNTVGTGVTPVLGKWNEQTLLHVDVSAGAWLLRNPNADLVTGLASVVEFHYTSTLQQTDTLRPVVAGPQTPTLLLQNNAGQVDLVSLTTGLHLQLFNNSALRVGTNLPFNATDRSYDAEFFIQFTRPY